MHPDPWDDVWPVILRVRRVSGFRTCAALRASEQPSAVQDTLSDFVPRMAAADAAWRSLVQQADAGSSSAPSSEEDALTRALSPEELKRARFAHTWNAKGEAAPLGPRYGRGVSLYLEVLPANVRDAVQHVLFRVLRIQRFRSRSALDTLLSALSDTAKKMGHLFHRSWRYLVNLNTLGGYRDPQPVSTQFEDLRSWATGDKLHCLPDEHGNWNEATFLRHFAEGIYLTLSDMPSVALANETAPDIERFSSDPGLWGNTGASSYHERIALRVGSRILQAGKDKMTTAFLMSPQQVRAALLAPQVQQRNKPIMKRETAKVRAVVNSDDILYLKMHFVSHWLELALRGNHRSTLFMSTSQRQRMWWDLALKSQQPRVKMPLDQSHFDWQQNRRMIDVAVAQIERVIAERACPRLRDQLLAVTRSVRWSLTHGGTILLKELGVTIPVEKGVMSGWRWTALLDTLMNIGELHAARHLVQEWGLGDPVRSFVAQGDDDQLELESPAAAIALVKAYQAMNFEVNPGKFWIDDGRDEFLRLVAVDGAVIGYPSRAINNILWRPPTTSDPPAGELAIRQQLQQWNLLVARGADSAACHRLMLMDMCGRCALSKRVIEAFLAAPASFGGAGLRSPHLDGGTPWVSITQKPQEQQFTVVSQLPGTAPAARYLAERKLPARILTRAVTARIPRQGLRRAPDAPVVSKLSTRIGSPVSVALYAPPLPRIAQHVPELIRTSLVADFVASRDFDGLREYIDPPSLGVYDRWRACLTQRAFGDLLTNGLPTQQPTVWGRGSEETSALWQLAVNGILTAAFNLRHVSIGWFRARAAAAVDSVILALGRSPRWSG